MGHDWKAERIREDLPFLERHRARLRHQLMKGLRALADEGEALATQIDPFLQFVAVATRALLNAFEAVYPRAARTALDIATQSVRFARDPQLPDTLRSWYYTLVTRYLAEYTEREQRAIRRVVEQAYLQGLDARQVAQQVAQRIQRVAGWQAERIARTELMRFYNLAHYSVYRTFATIVAYEYSVVLDDRTSHICRPLVGKRVAAHQLRHLPPFHPHCRTVLVPIFDGEQEEEGVPYTPPDELPIPPGWGNIEGLPLPQPTRIAEIPPPSRRVRQVPARPAPISPPPVPPSEPPTRLQFPEPDEPFEHVEPLGGSTGAELVKDSRGQLWVRKYGATPVQAVQEHLAHELYRAAGIPAPVSRLYVDAEGRPFLLSEYITDAQKLADLAGDALEAAQSQLRRGFVMDVLLENYDVVGLVSDNILVRRDGTVVRVDNGGSFTSRAQGGRKDYTESLQSLWSLRGRPLLNGQVFDTAATQVFGGIELDELLGQMRSVLERRGALEGVMRRFEAVLPEGIASRYRSEVRGNIRVLRQRLDLLQSLVEGMEDLREDFVDEYVDRWGQFYEVMLRDEETVKSVVELAHRMVQTARNPQISNAEAAMRFHGSEIMMARIQVWQSYLRHGMPEGVKSAAFRMVGDHAIGTNREGAFVLRKITLRYLRDKSLAGHEHGDWQSKRLEDVLEPSRIPLYEQGFMATHAQTYRVLRLLCSESPSPVFQQDLTIRLARVMTEGEWNAESTTPTEMQHQQFAALSTGSSAYNLFTTLSSFKEAISRLAITRVPIRRILGAFFMSDGLYYNESEYVLLGGARWQRVHTTRESRDVLRQLEDIEEGREERIQRAMMKLWDERDDSDILPAWKGAIWSTL